MLYHHELPNPRLVLMAVAVDCCVPYKGNEWWTDSLEMPLVKPWRVWTVDQQVGAHVLVLCFTMCCSFDALLTCPCPCRYNLVVGAMCAAYVVHMSLHCCGKDKMPPQSGQKRLFVFNVTTLTHCAWSGQCTLQVAGYVTSYSQDFTFLTVKGAGHMVPQFRPKQAYSMFIRMVTNEPFDCESLPSGCKTV